MSTETRLERLGLTHLADKPEELQAELERRTAEYDSRTALEMRALSEARVTGWPAIGAHIKSKMDAKQA